MNQGQGAMIAGQAQNAYTGAVNQSNKVPQVEQEMSRLDNDVGRLEQIVEQLCKQLSGVLRAEPPPTLAGGGDKVSEVLVPRAEGIRHVRNRISQVCNQIDSILARLET